MTWKTLEAPERSGSISKNFILTMSANAAKGRQRPSVRIVLRPDRLDCAWLTKGASVKVDLGEAEDVGRLRISQDGPFLVTQSGGAKRTVMRMRGRCRLSFRNCPGRWQALTKPRR